MATLSTNEVKPNFIFRNGSLWLPTRNDLTGRTILPRFVGGDFGSMIPAINVSIPGVWNSVAIPYENIVDFEYNFFAPGETARSAFLTFLDQTPIFIEEVIRRTMEKRHLPDFDITLEYGWRIQNVPTNLRDVISEDGFLTSGPTRFKVVNATYEHTNYGVMSTLTLQLSSNVITEAYRATVGNVNLEKLRNTDGFAQAVTDIVNGSVKNGVKFKTQVLSPDIQVDPGKVKEIQVDGTKTISEFLEDIRKTLFVGISDKGEPFGHVQIFKGETLISNTESGSSEQFYPIYFYHADRLPEFAFNIPVIQYPSNETPILSWKPNFSAEAQTHFLTSSIYRDRNSAGNEEQKSAKVQAVTAGNPSVPESAGENAPIEAINRIKDGAAKRTSAVATIDVDMIGDPTFSTINSQFVRIDVDNANIIQEGLVRDSSNFFANFPGLAQETSNVLPVIKGIPGNTSPFNGSYRVKGIKHKISAGEGFKTSLSLLWQLDIIL